MFDNRRLERRLQRIEYKLELVMQHLDITDSTAPQLNSPAGAAPLTTADVSRIDLLLAQGKKIQAIKVYREILPGVSLLEAKNAVEARERRYD